MPGAHTNPGAVITEGDGESNKANTAFLTKIQQGQAELHDRCHFTFGFYSACTSCLFFNIYITWKYWVDGKF